MQWWSTGHPHPGDLQWPGNWVVGQTHRFDSAHTPTCLFWRFSESERCPQWAWHLPVFEHLRTKNKLFIHLVTVCWNNVLSMVVDNIIKTSCLLLFKEIFVPLEHFSVMWRRHHYWWIAELFFIYILGTHGHWTHYRSHATQTLQLMGHVMLFMIWS